MKINILYASSHHKNTEKVAQSMADVFEIKPKNFLYASEKDITDSDIVGFGSGVYLAKFNQIFIKVIKDIKPVSKKKAFIFSTSGMGKNILFNRSHKEIRKILTKKGFDVVGEFNCPGFDTYSFLKFIGGINKGRPNQKDLAAATEFARKIKVKYVK